MEVGVTYKMKYLLLMFCIVPFVSTCTYRDTHHHNKNTYNYTGEETAHNLPRSSFTFVKVKEESRICLFKRCFKIGKTAHYTGSGFVVKNTKTGSLVITAAHVCASGPNAFYTTYELVDIDSKKYKAELLATDDSNDICMLYAKDLSRPSVKVSAQKPLQGERIYNIAAPVGIFDHQMMPIIDGFYNGEASKKWGLDRVAVYTLPAAPGSSGSMVLNDRFEIIGMVHSLLIRFKVISIGPTYESLTRFIELNIRKHSHL